VTHTTQPRSARSTDYKVVKAAVLIFSRHSVDEDSTASIAYSGRRQMPVGPTCRALHDAEDTGTEADRERERACKGYCVTHTLKCANHILHFVLGGIRPVVKDIFSQRILV
jgi:hypothetical protein